MRFDVEEFLRMQFAAVERKKSDMHVYQGTGFEFLRLNPFSALFIDMGLGKTIISLTLAAWLIEQDLEEKILVIGPVKVITDTWPTEIGLWEHTAPHKFKVLREDDDDPRLQEARKRAREWGRSEGLSGAEVAKLSQRMETVERIKIRKELLRDKSNIHMINREQVDWLVEMCERTGKWPYRTVIVDESSGFKDHTSGRFKALARVRRSGQITRMHLLTATPAAETYEHLWAQMYLLDLGERLGNKITGYRNRFFTYNRWSMKYKLRPGGEEDVLNLIKDITLVMKVEDYLKLDQPTIQMTPVILAPAQLALIEQMQKHFIVKLPNGAVVEADTAAALSAKLLQMASGVLYETVLDGDWETEDMKKVRKVHHLHDHKIDALREMYEEAQTQGATLLVSYHFKSSLDRLKKAFPKAEVMDREGKLVKKWNAGKIPMLLIHPQSGGHGLNLQKGGHNIVFFDIPWSLELYLQLIGRLARQGQTKPVLVRMLTAVGTNDVRVARLLMGKKDAQDSLFRMLKRLIKKYREELKELAENDI